MCGPRHPMLRILPVSTREICNDMPAPGDSHMAMSPGRSEQKTEKEIKISLQNQSGRGPTAVRSSRAARIDSRQRSRLDADGRRTTNPRANPWGLPRVPGCTAEAKSTGRRCQAPAVKGYPLSRTVKEAGLKCPEGIEPYSPDQDRARLLDRRPRCKAAATEASAGGLGPPQTCFHRRPHRGPAIDRNCLEEYDGSTRGALSHSRKATGWWHGGCSPPNGGCRGG